MPLGDVPPTNKKKKQQQHTIDQKDFESESFFLCVCIQGTM